MQPNFTILMRCAHTIPKLDRVVLMLCMPSSSFRSFDLLCPSFHATSAMLISPYWTTLTCVSFIPVYKKKKKKVMNKYRVLSKTRSGMENPKTL